MRRVYRVKNQELKNILLEHSVHKGEKVTKFKLCKDKKFLKAIGCDLNEISPNTIQSWYCRLANYEPKGEMTDEFIYNYHKNVTRLIPSNVTYLEWTKDKKNLKESSLSKEIKIKIGWDNKKKYLAILKMNDNDFEIEKYSHLKESDIKFMVDMLVDKEKYLQFENELEELISSGNEKIVDYIF